jgi:hypothetical protein
MYLTLINAISRDIKGLKTQKVRRRIAQSRGNQIQKADQSPSKKGNQSDQSGGRLDNINLAILEDPAYRLTDRERLALKIKIANYDLDSRPRHTPYNTGSRALITPSGILVR